MNRNLLVVLVSAMACCSFGCGEDGSTCTNNEKRCDGQDLLICTNNSWTTMQSCTYGCDAKRAECNSGDGNSDCVNNEKRCIGNDLQICANSKWTKVQTCSNGCDPTNKECYSSAQKPKCVDREKRCSGNELQVCVNNSWVKVQTCANGCNPANKECYSDDQGSQCKHNEKYCADEYTLNVCLNGKLLIQHCSDGCDFEKNMCKAEGGVACEGGKSECVDANTSRTCAFGTWVSIPCDGGCDSKTGECVDKDCTATSKGLCTPACNADKSEGYMWSAATGKNETVKCDGGKTCSVSEDSSIVCVSGSGGECTGETVTTGGVIGNCCDVKTYQQTCTDGNAHALVCWNGVVTQWDCVDNICTVNPTNSQRVECNKYKECTSASTEKCRATCSKDEKIAYYWNGKEVVARNCAAEGDKCVIENDKATCYTPGTGETCTPSVDKPVCIDDKSSVKYCRVKDKQFVEKVCPKCYVSGNIFYCNGDENLSNCTSSSTSKCRGACESDALGWRWDSYKGSVVAHECKPDEVCSISETGWISCRPNI